MSAAAIEQRTRSLALANKVRSDQAKFTRSIARMHCRDGAERVAEAILSGEVDSMPVARLLKSVRYVGHGKVQRLLIAANIRSESRRVDDLTDRQRAHLAALLRTRAW